jgi:hypothetical protein
MAEDLGLTDRMTRLERENDRLRTRLRRIVTAQFAVGLLVIASLALWFIASRVAPLVGIMQSTPNSTVAVRDGEFVFRNSKSTDTILLDNDKFGSPIIGLIDRNKNMRMHIKADGEAGSPSIQLFGKDGARVQLSQEPNGGSIMQMTGPNQKGGIFMTVAPDGSPRIQLRSNGGELLFEAPPNPPPIASQ